jgi:gluconate kinase
MLDSGFWILDFRPASSIQNPASSIQFPFFFVTSTHQNQNLTAMSKGMDKKKEDKKKPLKTLKEKRAEKQAKKANKS